MSENRNSSITQRTVGALLWMFLGTGVQAALHIVVVMVLARLVTPAEFGLVGATLIVMNFSLIFSEMGIGAAIVQRPELEERHLRTGFTMSIVLGLTLAAIVASGATGIAAFFRIDGFVPALRAMTVGLVLRGVSLVAESLLRRELRFRTLAVVQIVSYAIGYGVVGLGMALYGYGIWALVAAHLVQTFLLSVLYLGAQPHPKRPQLEPIAFKELLYFGGGLTTASLANTVANQGDRLVVGRWLGAAALGLYERAHQFMLFPTVMFGKVFAQVLFPAMAQVQSDRTRLARAYRRAIAAVAVLVVPMVGGAVVLAPELIHVTLGADWVEAILPFQLLAPGMFFGTANKMGDALARATGAVYRRAWRQTVFGGLVVGGSLAGQQYGLAGVAVGMLCALGVNFVLMAQLSLSLVGMRASGFAKAHLPGLFLGCIVLLQSTGLATALRAGSVAPIVTLVSCSFAGVVTVLLLARFFPAVALSDDGLWAVRTIRDRLPIGNV